MSSSDCSLFRAELQRALVEADSAARKSERSATSFFEQGHEHLFLCSECRAILESERALDEILDSMPAPQLPRTLARRVLARLERERLQDVDALLDELPAPDVPSDLSARLLGALAESRHDAQLDRLLERVPEPALPVGLAQRVLAGVADERRAQRSTVGTGARVLLGAAAALLLCAAGFVVWRRLLQDENSPGSSGAPVETTLAALNVEPELLAALDVLENWDVLMSDDMDLLLAALDPAELELFDEELMELDGVDGPNGVGGSQGARGDSSPAERRGG